MSVKILGLQVSGFKAIRAVEMKFSPDGGMTIIRGDNGQGKSSLTDAAWWLLTGKKSVDGSMVRNGYDKAEGRIELSDTIIERELSPSGKSRVKVTFKDAEVKSPEAFIRKIIGGNAINPGDFLSLSETEKRKKIGDILGIDTCELDRKINELYQERTLKSREITNAGGYVQVPEKTEEADMKALLCRLAEYERMRDDEITKISAFNTEQRRLGQNIEDLNSQKSMAIGVICALETQLESARMELEDINKEILNAEQPKEALPEQSKYTGKIMGIKESISGASEQNKKAAEYAAAIERNKKLKSLESEKKKMTKEIELLRSKKGDYIAQKVSKIPGLGISDETITYKGIPISNLSTSEQLSLATEIIGSSGELRAIFLDRGESFGPEKIKALDDYAVTHDIQLFVTVVAGEPPEKEDNVFYIEAGEIKE